MHRYLWPFLKDVSKSWWARISLPGSVIGYISRVFDIVPYAQPVAWGLGGLAVLGLFIAILGTYRDQVDRIAELSAMKAAEGYLPGIYLEKIRAEVVFNLDYSSMDTAMIRDEAWRNLTPEQAALLTYDVRSDCAKFYMHSRGLKELGQKSPIELLERQKIQKAQRQLTVSGVVALRSIDQEIQRRTGKV